MLSSLHWEVFCARSWKHSNAECRFWRSARPPDKDEDLKINKHGKPIPDSESGSDSESESDDDQESDSLTGADGDLMAMLFDIRVIVVVGAIIIGLGLYFSKKGATPATVHVAVPVAQPVAPAVPPRVPQD